MRYPPDLVAMLIAHERGELGPHGTVVLFQALIDSGEAWKLQGSYGRQAAALIEQGYCHGPSAEPDPANGCIHEWADDDSCCFCGAQR